MFKGIGIPESGWFCLYNPEYWALESGILLRESTIPLAIEIRNISSTEEESGIQYLNPESTRIHGHEIQNPRLAWLPYSATQPFLVSSRNVWWGGTLRDDTKNGCVADYGFPYMQYIVSLIFPTVIINLSVREMVLPTKIAQTEPPHHMSLVALFITNLRRRKWRSVFRFWRIEASFVDPTLIVWKRATAWD